MKQYLASTKHSTHCCQSESFLFAQVSAMGRLLLLFYFVLCSQNLEECCVPLPQQGLNKYSWTNSLNNHTVGSHLLLKSMSLVLVGDVHPSANILALGINRPIRSAPASWLPQMFSQPCHTWVGEDFRSLTRSGDNWNPVSV